MSRPLQLGRRMFLRAATGATVGIPFLSSLLPRTARAQVAAQPLRFLSMKSQSGPLATAWYPTSTPAGYQLRDTKYASTANTHARTTYLPARERGAS